MGTSDADNIVSECMEHKTARPSRISVAQATNLDMVEHSAAGLFDRGGSCVDRIGIVQIVRGHLGHPLSPRHPQKPIAAKTDRGEERGG